MDPTTGRGKQLHLIQMLLLPFIPIMALITQNVVNMLTVLEHQYDVQESIDQVRWNSAHPAVCTTVGPAAGPYSKLSAAGLCYNLSGASLCYEHSAAGSETFSSTFLYR